MQPFSFECSTIHLPGPASTETALAALKQSVIASPALASVLLIETSMIFARGGPTLISTVRETDRPLASSAVNVYFAPSFGSTTMQRATAGHTRSTGGLRRTDFAFSTP